MDGKRLLSEGEASTFSTRFRHLGRRPGRQEDYGRGGCVKELEDFVSIVSAAKGYFKTRLAMGEGSIVFDIEKGRSGTGGRLPEEALAQLEKRVRKCRRCLLHKTRTNVVFGAGSGKTRLVFVGEAPGRDEDIQGKPFVGRAGQLLTRIIEAAKLDRGDVYITNVVKCRPEGNRDPLPQEMELCSIYLAEQLEILKPKVICALGRFAAQALSGRKLPVAGYRNENLFYKGTRVIPTYHPAACLRNPSLKRLVWEDVQKLMHVWKNA
jgi:uracil-DNA glycosylase family 4